MQLSDLIEENTIESVTKKTSITEGVLSKLRDKEFEALKKTQALGAISIIEREYGVDLSALRQEGKEYFDSNTPLEDGLTVLKPIDEEKRFIPKLFSLMLLFLLAYGAWYLFIEYYKQKIDPLDPQSEKSLIGTILHVQNAAADEDKQSTVEKSTATESSVTESTVEENTTAKGTSQSQKPNEADQVHTAAGEMNRGGTEYTISNNQEMESETAYPALEEKNDTIETVENSEVVEQNSSTEEVPVATRHETMMLLPKKIMWFRMINLDTKKATAYQRKNKHKIDVRENAWLFTAKNAQFSITDDDLLEEFIDKEELFLRFDQDGVHRLSRDEFRAAEK